ncbi:MAG: 30S ribosomal protein S12 methylthiotransferase RimO [Ignavibacteria bacterium]|nr:30S ribosomal protein S12 methylthiotransferase RimO [Ignavibacteria bacterium]
MKVKKDKIKIITLGCSKNLVDSEFIMSQMKSNDIEIVEDEKNSNTVLINTCGFIEAAKQESIDTILRAVDLKEKKKIQNVYVAGCLSDRYGIELEKEIPQVDKYFGATDKHQTVVDILNEIGVDYKSSLLGERIITTPNHFAYLKISEGCNNPCSFCAIPVMRGKHVSKPLKQIVMEGQSLASKGVKELIVIGQDTTYWGFDTDNKRNVTVVLEELSKLKGVEWIRLMYAYPSRFPLELIDALKNIDNVCKYLDMPIQHIADNVLKSMRRGITTKTTMNLLEKLRKEVPGIALRTTFITGYPDETEKDFEQLLNFVKEFKFDRLGVFPYSHEEGTAAFDLPDRIPMKEKLLRQKLLLDAQRENSLDTNKGSIGKEFKVIIDREEKEYYIGRTYKDAPEIDQEVYVNKNEKLEIGNFCSVKIYDSEEFDLFAEKV